MIKPNSFYRFEQAWSAGFWPQNQIISDLLNEMYAYINSQLATWANVGTTTYPEFSNIVKNYTEANNGYPYYGDFEFRSFSLTSTSFTIVITNVSLLATDNTQSIVISGTMNATTKVITALPTLVPFTPGAYSGSFGATLINEEKKIAEALEVVYQNGSALFPITYSYDAVNKIATSGLARGSNWKLWNDIEPNRLPYPTSPNTNRRIFSLPQLNPDDQYIISIMERVIQASLADADYTNSVLAVINSFTAPDGWTITINHPSYTTYERVQVNYSDNSGRRKFILVGRFDNAWLWQRFVSDASGAAYNFLSVYTETTQLPYEVNQAGRWLYNDNTFDYEFVEFNSGCYESQEFYPMPAKPGDQWQFNVDPIDANLVGLNSVNVGLFTEDGSLIQKIGEANNNINCETIINPQFQASVTIPSQNGCYRMGLYLLPSDDPEPPTEDCTLIFEQYLDGATQGTALIEQLNIINTGLYNSVTFSLSDGTKYTWTLPTSFITPEMLVNWMNTNIPLMNAVYFDDGEGNDYFTFQWTKTLPCQESAYFMSMYQSDVEGNEIEGGGDYPFWTSVQNYCLCGEKCEVNWVFTGFSTTMVNTVNSYAGEGYYLTLGLLGVSGLTQIYQIEITGDGLSAQGIANWANCIQGMTSSYNAEYDWVDFNWTIDIPCDTTLQADFTILDAEGNSPLPLGWLFIEPSQSCACNTSSNDYALYSLSNIINIDASDCFSTMLEFWSDNNTINSGFEYFNNWKQRIRLGINGGGEKPVIEESLYRQSNGVHRRPQSKQDLSLDLHTDFIDLPTQLALVDATRHPYLVWNNKNIFVKGDVEVATIQDFTTQSSFETLAQVKFQALLQGFQPGNSSCLTC